MSNIERVSDSADVLLGRAEVRLENSFIVRVPVPNGALPFDEYKVRAKIDQDIEEEFLASKDMVLVKFVAAWASVIVPGMIFMTSQDPEINGLGPIFCMVLLACLMSFAVGALTSYPYDFLTAKRKRNTRLSAAGLGVASAHIDEDDWTVVRSYRLLSVSLEELRKLDLPVSLELSLTDVEREFHLRLGRYQASDDLGVRTACVEKLKGLAVQASALLEAQEIKARVEQTQLDSALETDGIDLRQVIQATADETVALIPNDMVLRMTGEVREIAP